MSVLYYCSLFNDLKLVTPILRRYIQSINPFASTRRRKKRLSRKNKLLKTRVSNAVGLESGDINDASTKIKAKHRRILPSEIYKGPPLHRLADVKAVPPGTDIK